MNTGFLLSIYKSAPSFQLMLLYLAAFSASQLAAASHEAIELNWDASNPSQINTSYCAGSYLPFTPKPFDQSIAKNKQPIYTNADTSESTQGTTRLEGNVELRQGNLAITSDTAVFDNNQSTIDIEGHVKFYRPNMIIESNDANFNMLDSQATLNKAQLALPDSELRATAQKIDYHADDTVTMNQGSLTFCPPGDNTWAIHSNNITLDPSTGFGEADHAILKIGSVPVFYLPWMSFPIDDQRRSGFLFPTLVQSSKAGLDVTTPYYLNLAPNYDALLTPRFTELRGTSLETNIRHLGQNSEQSLNTTWVLNDPLSNPNRWLLNYNLNTDLTNVLSSSVNINRVSDNELLDDYSLSTSDETSLTSSAQVNYKGSSPILSSASISVITRQNLGSGIAAYDQLPHATLSGGMSLNQEQQLISADYTVDLTRFIRDTSSLTGANKITGTRSHIVPSLSSSWVNEYSFIKPKLSLPITNYQLSDTPATTSAQLTRIIPQLEIDGGLIFERALSKGYTQTLEPRLYYTYTPYRQQNDVAVFDTSQTAKPLYQPNRFSGYDRIADTNRITLGLDSQFFNNKGWQKAKLSISQIHYLSDRKVQLSSSTSANTETFSPIYGLMNYQFTPNWSSGAGVDWNPSSGIVEATSLNTKYQLNEKIIDVKYTQTLDSTEQGEMSLIWPLTPKWTLMAKHKEDLLNQQLQDSIFGVEYANCCWKGRLASRSWLVNAEEGMEHGIFFELSLKGLGRSDKQLTSGNQVRMADFMKGITGYNEYTQ